MNYLKFESKVVDVPEYRYQFYLKQVEDLNAEKRIYKLTMKHMNQVNLEKFKNHIIEKEHEIQLMESQMLMS